MAGGRLHVESDCPVESLAPRQPHAEPAASARAADSCASVAGQLPARRSGGCYCSRGGGGGGGGTGGGRGGDTRGGHGWLVCAPEADAPTFRYDRVYLRLRLRLSLGCGAHCIAHAW